MPRESTSTRTTRSTVVFHEPFRLGRDPRELPAGSYVLHTHEEVHDGGSRPVYLATSAELIVEEAGRTTSRMTRSSDVHAALVLETERRALLAGQNENPDRGQPTEMTKWLGRVL